MSAETENPPADAKPEVKTPPPPKPVAKKPEESVELPAFEKGISDKITEKFGDTTRLPPV